MPRRAIFLSSRGVKKKFPYNRSAHAQIRLFIGREALKSMSLHDPKIFKYLVLLYQI